MNAFKTGNKGLALTAGILLAVVVVLALVFFLTRRDSALEFEPAQGPKLEIAIDDAPTEMTIGVIYSLTDDPLVESSLLENAEGAQVAAYRLGLGDTKVTFVTQDDRGTADGAKNAVETLESRGVSAILVATAGPQSEVIAQEAATRQIATIFLEGGVTTAGSWAMAPGEETTADLLNSDLVERGIQNVLVLDYDQELSGVNARKLFNYTSMASNDELIEQIVEAVQDPDMAIQAVAISGPSAYQSELLALLQSRGISLPTFVTAEARSPRFSDDIAARGVAVADLSSVGLPDADTVALESGARGDSSVMYFTALDLLQGRADAWDLLGEQEFSKVAARASGAAHDAVLAIVHAAAALSAEAGDVYAALSHVTLSQADSTAVGDYDYSSATPGALANGVLRATTDNLGLRATEPNHIFWFAPAQD